MTEYAKPPETWTRDEKTAFRGGAWCALRLPDVANPYEEERLAAAWLAGFKAQAALAAAAEETTQ